MQLPAGDIDSARDDKSSVTEIDETDLATILDPPTAPEIGRQAGLAPVRDPGVRDRCHRCIVTFGKIQGSMSEVTLNAVVAVPAPVLRWQGDYFAAEVGG